jgi:DUF2934 family protein
MDKNDVPSPSAFDPPAEAEWHRMIAEAAYYRAQKPEFSGESALEHWLAAEVEIGILLSGGSQDASSRPAPSNAEAEAELAQTLTGKSSKPKSPANEARKIQ